ncbi:serine/threonine kinase 16 [Penicillium nucicola]|uniref:serine/threonine kinase 16 n=1 Tax=Penicillium nucicola TaxID=1850975 RepID=UPI0025458A6D|nr:serine/threonine kinase 16 [Penicillium nucicola]KAJ5747043.1 serine/threonine kinase 16 [Penicillium nucicola]
MWPPGTVILEDPTAATREDIILQPRPTDDPNDPLNWPQWRKYLNMGLVCFYVAMVAELINASTPTWGPMQKDLGFSYEILNDSYAAGCAALGIGSVILIPFALKFGRRPLYLFSTIAQFAVSIWSAKMQTVADLMLVNIFQCLFGSLAEVIVQMTIADVFFVHQRGRMNAFYVWTWLLTSSMGVLVAGFVAQGQGWRWIWWWNVIILGITILLVGFGYEETKYCPTEPVLTSNMQPTTNNNHPVPSVISDDAKFATSDISEAKSMVKKQHQPGTLDTDSVLFQSANENLPANITTVTINPNIPKRTYWQRLAIVTTSTSSEPNESFFRHMYQPLILMTTIPAVAYTALVYGILVGLGDVMSTTMSTYLPQSPYNFNSSQIGLMSLPKMIGVTIGALILGPMSDWWIVYLSRRRGGVYDPETRLWCIVPFLPFVPVGALLFGIGLNNDVSWPVIAVGLALYNVGIAPINTIMITYLTDSYQDIIGDAVVGVTLSRNTFSTVFIFALSPWIAKMGLQNVFIVILVIVCALLMFVGVFIRYGKSFREFSAARYEYYAARQYRGRDAEQFSH